MTGPHEFKCVECNDWILEYDLQKHYVVEHDYTPEGAEEMLDSEYITLNQREIDYHSDKALARAIDSWKEAKHG